MGGRYTIGIVLPTRNKTIPEYPSSGFISQYNTITVKKVVEEETEEGEEEEEKEQEQEVIGDYFRSVVNLGDCF